jgi:hypothetical protein
MVKSIYIGVINSIDSLLYKGEIGLSVKLFLESVIPFEKIKEESISKYKDTLSTLSVSVSSVGDFNNALIQIFDVQSKCPLLELNINDMYQSSNPIIPALEKSLESEIYFPHFGIVEITNINILKKDMTKQQLEGIIFIFRELINHSFNCFIISNDIVNQFELDKIDGFLDYLAVKFDFNNDKYFRIINDYHQM